MDDEDRPKTRSADGNFGAASLLAGESLDSFSLDELDARIVLLETEIARIASHRKKAADHIHAAAALFGRKS